MKRACSVLLLLALLCLCACGESLPEQTSSAAAVQTTATAQYTTIEESSKEALPPMEAIAPFEDYAISLAANHYFFDEVNMQSREEKPFDTEELAALAEVNSLRVSGSLQSLEDISKYFPKLRYLSLTTSDVIGPSWFSQVQQEDLAELGELKALEFGTGTPVNPNLFAHLPYLNIISGAFDDDGKQIDLQLAQHSVLGEEYILRRMGAWPVEYLRLNYNQFVYEFLVKAPEEGSYGPGVSTDTEAWLFISKRGRDGYTCVDSYGPLPRYAYYNGIHGGLVFADANFDGREDILILYALEGNESRPYYHALLQQSNGDYKRCESFREIPHPELCAKDKTIRGSSRGGAGARYYELYAYQNKSFVNIESLYRHWVFAGGNEDGEPEGYDAYDVTEKAASENAKTLTYSPDNYSKAQLKKMFLDDNSKWGLESNKWLHLSEIQNAMLMRIIS